MKKIIFLLLAAMAVVLAFSSCNQGVGAKEVSLKTQEDSLNYALGVANGAGIRSSYFMNDSTSDNLSKLLKASDDAFNNNSKDEIYNYGKKIGTMLKGQKTNGLMFDSTLTFKEDLIVQGIVNGMKGFEEGMSVEAGKTYLQNTMVALQQKRQQEMMQSQPNPAPADTLAVDSVKK